MSFLKKGNTLLIILSAPSGAGKTTLCSRLLRELPELAVSISATTRKPRKNGNHLEQHGKEYLFLTAEQFKAGIEKGDFSEWAQVHGNHYGTPKEFIENCFVQGQSVLLDIDVQGAQSLREAFSGRHLSIFIAPPSLQELEKRLRLRGSETDDSIAHRMRNARLEMSEASKFDLIVVNDRLEEAFQKLKQAVEKHIYG